MGRGCSLGDQLLDILLIAWWWGNQESISSTFWFQMVWDLCAFGQHTVNIFAWWGFQLLQKNSKDMAQDIIYSLWSEVKWKSLSHVQLFATPWSIWSMEFSRPEYCSGLPFPSAGDLPNRGIKPRSPALQVDSLLTELSRKPQTGQSGMK